MAVCKEESLYLHVMHGNIHGIKALHSEGAGLEWISQGKTPLIAASGQGRLYDVAKTLIELGANVNAYCPGPHGTSLHLAAEKGLEQTVKLLLSSGATALILNDDSETPLDIARAKGYTNIVRAIEKHVSLFADWLKEIHGPRFVRHLVYCWHATWRWVVIMPRASYDFGELLKLELLIYAREEDAKPCKIVPLWKANLEEPIFNPSNPTATISEASTSTRLKFAPAREDKKDRMQLFCNACKGILPVMPSVPPSNDQIPVTNYSEDEELAMAISASLQTAANERLLHNERYVRSYLNISDLEIQEAVGNLSPDSVPSAPPISDADVDDHTILHPSDPEIEEADSSTHDNLTPASVPSAPPISDVDVDDHAILHPSNPEIQEADSTIHENLSPVFVPSAPISDSPIDDDDDDDDDDDEDDDDDDDDDGDDEDGILSSKGDKNVSPCCIICLDGPVEGACIPCGHMIGCMSCLNDLKAMEYGCPVCRAVIDQVTRIYCAV